MQIKYNSNSSLIVLIVDEIELLMSNIVDRWILRISSQSKTTTCNVTRYDSLDVTTFYLFFLPAESPSIEWMDIPERLGISDVSGHWPSTYNDLPLAGMMQLCNQNQYIHKKWLFKTVNCSDLYERFISNSLINSVSMTTPLLSGILWRQDGIINYLLGMFSRHVM